MGVDGDQYLTIYGPKADLDALEACGCELTVEEANIPYPKLEGINHKYVGLPTEGRPRYFACHKKTPDPEAILFADWNDPAKVSRIYDRKLLVKHIYRNGPEYSFFVLLLANYPKCCLVNQIYAEEGFCERILLRFTPRGTIHVHLVNWGCGAQYFHGHCDEFRKKVALKDEPTSLDLSHVRYKLRFGGKPNIFFVENLFKSIGINPSIAKWNRWNEFRFVSKHQSWQPTTYVNILRRRFPDFVIHGEIQDLHGNHVEVIDCEEGYGFREWKNITKEEERTLDDFSLKE